MDWKKVKLMLIVLFILINIFLLQMLYNKNIKGYVDTINAIETVFNSNNVTLIPNVDNIDKNIRMSKLFISDNNGINENLVITLEESENYTHIGKKKRVIDIAELLANFIRDIAPKDLIIKNISLGYFFNSNQVNDDVVSGEAEPCWIIGTSNGKYIYSAYNGDLLLYN